MKEYPLINEQQYESFSLEDRKLRVAQTKIGALLGIILIPAGVMLEFSYYPDHILDFALLRLVVALIHAAIYFYLRNKDDLEGIDYLSVLWALSPIIMINYMIFVSEGSISPYYAGLNLMILITCVLLPYTLFESITYSLCVLVMYTAACLLHQAEPFHLDLYLINMYFIALTCILSVVAGYYFNLRRIKDYLLNIELNKRNEELQKLDKMRANFFANVSHEFRTPLTLILSPIQELLEQYRSLPEQAVSRLKIIKDNSLRLLRLVDDLLDVIKLEEAKIDMEVECINLNTFLSGLYNSSLHYAESRDIAFTLNLPEEEVHILSDYYALERVILNLISNAMKFTDKKGSVAIILEVDGYDIYICVKDTGIGISQKDIPLIFDRFHQSTDNENKNVHGTGIGLALTKELVDALGGFISVTSELNQGSEFNVYFPEAKLDSEQIIYEQEKKLVDILLPSRRTALLPVESIEEIPPSETGNRVAETILVADDEPDMRRYIVSILEDKYIVHQAKDGEETLEKAESVKPAIIVLDYMMPKIDGFNVCKRLRASPIYNNTKIMILTARIDEDAKINVLREGADDFITKPFSKTEVITRIDNMMQAHIHERDIRESHVELKKAYQNLQEIKAQLMQSEKLNSLGMLAAGIIHEINNPLNYINIATQAAKGDVQKKKYENLSDTFSDITEGVNRIMQITSSLKEFTNPQLNNKAMTCVPLGGVLDLAVKLTSHSCKDIQVDTTNVIDFKIVANSTQLSQVFVNLITNAVFSIKQAERDDGRIIFSTEENDSNVSIRISDNGQGVDTDLIDKVFDPFFTTKDVGKGLGLGLSICYGIVQDHGGEITIDSEPGQGAEVTITLPIAA